MKIGFKIFRASKQFICISKYLQLFCSFKSGLKKVFTHVLLTGQGSANSGFYDTEMNQLDATVQVGSTVLQIRESPTLPSRGGTESKLQGDGTFRIESFFDIFPEISLADKTVGRRHAYLRNQQGTYTVEDLNALNKTRLNGVTLTPHEERTLKDGDILRFGSVEVRFELR